MWGLGFTFRLLPLSIHMIQRPSKLQTPPLTGAQGEIGKWNPVITPIRAVGKIMVALWVV